jgi:hypothetical protein
MAYKFTNGSNIYACKVIIHVITSPLFFGAYIPCKMKGDIWQPPHIKVKVEQNRILIISLQECTRIKLCEE